MAQSTNREKKINRIYTYLDEIAANDTLDEGYIDDLLAVVSEYRLMAEQMKR